MSFKDEEIIKVFSDAIENSNKRLTSPYDTVATVTKVEDDIAFIRIPGGADETPVKRTINAKPGDKVQVRIKNNGSFIMGNYTSPPTDDRVAIIARRIANDAQYTAVKADQNATTANRTAQTAYTNATTANRTAQTAYTNAGNALTAAKASVSSDTLHYLATTEDSGITIDTEGWTTTIQSIDPVNKYLWIYHTYTKANGNAVNTQPVITGVWGNTGLKGDAGVGITSVEPQYYLSDSRSSLSGGSWLSSLTYVSGKYIWTREKTTYDDTTVGYSTGIYNSALTESWVNAATAHQIATGINQYFWHDTNGAHVTQISQADFEDDPLNGGGNTLITGTGMAVRDGLVERASFGSSGAIIGRPYDPNSSENESHAEVNFNSFELIDKEGNKYLHISDLRNASGYATITETFTGDGTRNYVNVSFSILEVVSATDSSNPQNTVKSVLGQSVRFVSILSKGAVITVVYKTTSSRCKTYMFGTRKEGYGSGPYSVIMGENNAATRSFSVALGSDNVSSGNSSHAQNKGTVATEYAQTAIGRYNKATRTGSGTKTDPYVYTDVGNYLFIIGNGYGDATKERSNAFTVDPDGNVKAAGHIKSTITQETDIDKVLTPASGITVDLVEFTRAGNVATLYIRFYSSSAKSGTWRVATLEHGYTPYSEVGFLTGTAQSIGHINSGGWVQYVGSLTANTYGYVKAMYIIE